MIVAPAAAIRRLLCRLGHDALSTLLGASKNGYGNNRAGLERIAGAPVEIDLVQEEAVVPVDISVEAGQVVTRPEIRIEIHVKLVVIGRWLVQHVGAGSNLIDDGVECSRQPGLIAGFVVACVRRLGRVTTICAGSAGARILSGGSSVHSVAVEIRADLIEGKANDERLDRRIGRVQLIKRGIYAASLSRKVGGIGVTNDTRGAQAIGVNAAIPATTTRRAISATTVNIGFGPILDAVLARRDCARRPGALTCCAVRR